MDIIFNIKIETIKDLLIKFVEVLYNNIYRKVQHRKQTLIFPLKEF